MLGWIGIGPIDWIGDPDNAFALVVFWDVWQWTPFCALILLAGLTTVPDEIEEAARLETKSWLTVLRHVQLPYLVPGLVAIMILRTADTLKLFDMVFTMTRGGPGNATEFISLLIQRTGFRAFDQGVASAQAVVLLAITVHPQHDLHQGVLQGGPLTWPPPVPVRPGASCRSSSCCCSS